VHHIHTVLGGCLKAAMRKGLISSSPVARAEAPSPGEANHGIALDAEQLRTLVDGFRGSALFGIVAVGAFTGMRRNEILALQWSDLDFDKRTLRVERTIEETEKYGITFKPPKTARGARVITVDEGLLSLLRVEHERYLRIKAGVPDGAVVDLRFAKL